LTLDLGLRLDKYSLLAKNAAAVRVWAWLLRGEDGHGAARVLQPDVPDPTDENLLLASAPQAAVFVPGLQ